MNNPYKILGIDRNATKKEIKNAELKKMLENQETKLYGSSFLRKCSMILFQPYKRLAADFLFPAKLRSYRPKHIKPIEINNVQFNFPLERNNTINKMKKFYDNK
jgi:hypothetical protein